MKRELEESEASGQRAELDPGLREAGGWLEEDWRWLESARPAPRDSRLGWGWAGLGLALGLPL